MSVHWSILGLLLRDPESHGPYVALSLIRLYTEERQINVWSSLNSATKHIYDVCQLKKIVFQVSKILLNMAVAALQYLSYGLSFNKTISLMQLMAVYSS